jgi:hypothetical protein
MSNTKHEVTAYDRVPSTAAVSVAQVEAYLRRTGWTLFGRSMRYVRWTLPDRSSIVPLPRPSSEALPFVILGQAVDSIARHEQRQPSAVLADIAREPEQ